MLLFNQNNPFEHTQFWKFYLLQKYVLLKIENSFHCVVSSQWEYLSSQMFENVVFWKNNLFEKIQFWEAGSVSLKCYFFLHRYMVRNIKNGFYWLLCFHYEYLRAQRLKNAYFFDKISTFEQTQFWKWQWSVWNFFLFYKVLWVR